jgi:hypothetical protein
MTDVKSDAKLLHKTGLDPGSLAARMIDFMETNRLGLPALAAAADVVAAECRHNVWVLDEVKEAPGPGHSIDWWPEFLDAVAAADEKCKAAMNALRAGGSQQAFCNEMAAVAAFYNSRIVTGKREDDWSETFQAS